MGSPLSNSGLLTVREPQRGGVPEDEKIVTMADRGSLSPQRGEGLRVRGETAQVVGNHHQHFSFIESPPSDFRMHWHREPGGLRSMAWSDAVQLELTLRVLSPKIDASNYIAHQ